MLSYTSHFLDNNAIAKTRGGYQSHAMMKVTSFPSPAAHWLALISVSVALSQTSLHCQIMDMGLVHCMGCLFTFPVIGPVPITLLDDRGT